MSCRKEVSRSSNRCPLNEASWLPFSNPKKKRSIGCAGCQRRSVNSKEIPPKPGPRRGVRTRTRASVCRSVRSSNNDATVEGRTGTVSGGDSSRVFPHLSEDVGHRVNSYTTRTTAGPHPPETRVTRPSPGSRQFRQSRPDLLPGPLPRSGPRRQRNHLQETWRLRISPFANCPAEPDRRLLLLQRRTRLQGGPPQSHRHRRRPARSNEDLTLGQAFQLVGQLKTARGKPARSR